MTTTKALVLKQRPSASSPNFSSEFFELVDTPLRELGHGDFRVRVSVLSCDPTQRIWITEKPQYMPPVAIGEPMRSGFGGTVVESKSRRFPVGSNVTGLGQWSEELVFNESSTAVSLLAPGVPLDVGVASGTCPETAFVGLFCTGPKGLRPGETVLITGAAGATGSAAVQMAKAVGAVVIASAGGPAKCAFVRELGADHVIDYKNERFAKRLAELAHGKIDMVFDNVGGAQLDAALPALALGGRVIICGAISEYEDESTRYGLKNYTALLMRRASMTGFIIMDDMKAVAEARRAIRNWLRTGQLKIQIDPSEGTLADTPNTVARLFRGENTGKTLHILKAKL